MTKKKPGGAKKSIGKKKPNKAKKKAAVARKPPLAKLSSQKKKTARKVGPAAKKNRTSRSASTKEPRSPERSTLGRGTFPVTEGRSKIGRNSASAGQAGDLQGLSRRSVADSESVEELLEEGQTYEAEAISGVEDALDPDQGEVTTHEIAADDVPEEYLDED